MLKKSLSALVLALAMSAFADDIMPIDITIRDFPVGYHGFEMFDADRDAGGECAGSNADVANGYATPSNQICVYNCSSSDGIQCVGGNYGFCDKGGGTPLEYGEYDDCDEVTVPGLSNRAKKRGYKQGPDIEKRADNGRLCRGGWGNKVYVTRGMVKQNLDYSQCNKDNMVGEETDPQYIRGQLCARPFADNGACYGKDLPLWFTNGDHTRHTVGIMELKRVDPNSPIYMIKHDYNTYVDWNGYGHDNGYFPLDKYEDKSKSPNPDYSPFGMQSLNVWCPNKNPGAYNHWDWDYGEDCFAWRVAAGGTGGNSGSWGSDAASGGKLRPESARTAAQNRGIMRKLHNYGFTIAGSAEFKYAPGKNDIFEFVGDDDMWIFIDGELVVDLGGNHLAAPAKINIDDYASGRQGWGENSTHVINFFYADRQTDGSNIQLKMAITNLSPPRYGAPRINKAETEIKSDGSTETMIWVTTKLDMVTMTKFLNTNEQYPIIMHKAGEREIWAYNLWSIEFVKSDGSNGYIYTITGEVCKTKNDCNATLYALNSGDSLSFNVKAGQDIESDGFIDHAGFGLPDETWYIMSEGKAPATTKAWKINVTNLPPIDFKPEKPDNDPRKPDFDMDSWFTGNPDGGKGSGGGNFSDGGGSLPGKFDGNGLFPSINQIWNPATGQMEALPNGSGNTTVHGFGVKGTPIPAARAGELILTSFPNAHPNAPGVPTKDNILVSYKDWLENDEYQKFFGLPPVSYDGYPYGVADPTVQQPNGGYAFVKNGFPGESSVGGIQVAPTRCIQDGDPEKPRINCLNFSLAAKQPFQIAVTVYDQLGNFVTQYRETVTEQEFRSAVQGPSFLENTGVELINASSDCVRPTSATANQNVPGGFGHKNTLTINGMVKVNVNIYPFSAAGRRFGNGVYLLKIDRVDMPYEGCVNNAGAAMFVKPGFVRYHADTKFGWMRSSPEKK